MKKVLFHRSEGSIRWYSELGPLSYIIWDEKSLGRLLTSPYLNELTPIGTPILQIPIIQHSPVDFRILKPVINAFSPFNQVIYISSINEETHNSLRALCAPSLLGYALQSLHQSSCSYRGECFVFSFALNGSAAQILIALFSTFVIAAQMLCFISILAMFWERNAGSCMPTTEGLDLVIIL